MSARKLTTAARLGPAATTTAIDRLERAGFVTRGRRRHPAADPGLRDRGR
ncbi:MarR family transcriptional regulator [Streptomyces sp. WAC05374]|nr:MarR family transcriptional regulator [Streptomyces sp. WAC05374]TDF36992.1 MarR family transcriptional regulator [Streptomyces sp. WAC05374]TDF46487.1 MarR family transcriptional regulator [Streptomyces sp. WAC05374]TDF47588.1 MarR family transcriptional regulator [Streptomyces sp. WAC05374]